MRFSAVRSIIWRCGMDPVSSLFQQLQNIATKAGEAATAAGEQLQAAAQAAADAVAPAFDDVTDRVGDFAQRAYNATEERVGEAADFVREHTSSVAGAAAENLSLDEVGRKIASLGVPAIVFAIAAANAGAMGLAGGAVVTFALASLGGPAGMIGGLIALGVLTVIADAVGKYGIRSVLVAAFLARRDQGIPIAQLHEEIDGLWISDELKVLLKTELARPQS